MQALRFIREEIVADKVRVTALKIAIDLLWLRPGKVGGTEQYIRNLLDSFQKLERDFEFILLTSIDNADTFQHYVKDKRFSLLVADIKNANISKRILWQNLFQNRLLKKNGIRYCFTPVYCKPWFNGGVEYVVTIHDLQAWHYPHYHPFHEVAYSKLCWYCDGKNAKKIIAISNWVKSDIIEKLKISGDKIDVIYIPVIVKRDEMKEFCEVQQNYDLKEKYFYTVSQLIPHKNLEILLLVMEKIVRENLNLPHKLVITGINGNAAEQIQKMIKSKHLEQNIILTGYIGNSVRNTLYKHCELFLYPSIFEGFGMPPVEAMLLGKTVITTKCTSLPEVTQGKAEYIDEPGNVDKWISKIIQCMDKRDESDNKVFDANVYNGEDLANKYLDLFLTIFQ